MTRHVEVKDTGKLHSLQAPGLDVWQLKIEEHLAINKFA
jgi:hypothetical protein